jgi:peptidoglycan/xylan/chitin deacetylase (PgdA/CDA1 family)
MKPCLAIARCAYYAVHEVKQYQMSPKHLLFSIARGLGAFTLARLLTRRRVRILCYHGGCIGDEGAFNQKLFSKASLLEARLRWLRSKGFNPVSLDAAVDHLSGGQSLPRLPVVVTLDDGWYSTARDLLPTLERHGFPATLYLATRVFESGMPVTDVTVRYIIWKAEPKRVRVECISMGVDGEYDLALEPQREALAQAVEIWLDSVPETVNERHERIERFAAAVGVSSQQLDLKSRRFSYMNTRELRSCMQTNCSVQLHGHDHVYPTGQPLLLKLDVERCRDALLAHGVPSPFHYCYPSGAYDGHAPEVLAELGVRSATTCQPGLVSRVEGEQRFYLPRFLDGGSVSQLEFEADMSGLTPLLRYLLRRSGRSGVPSES